MKRLISALALACALAPNGVFAATTQPDLSSRLKGRILLQVEQHGEAWFVHDDGLRYYMKHGEAAYEMMRSFGLGISDKDLAAIPSVNAAADFAQATNVCKSSPLAARLSGKILLQVEQHGEAWYVDPATCRRVYMKDGAEAYQIMRLRGLGITDADLSGIESGYLLSSECDDEFEMTDDGVVARFVCAADGIRVVAEGNRVTQEVGITLDVSVPEEETWIDVDGQRLSLVPFVTQLVGVGSTYLLGYLVESLAALTVPVEVTSEADGELALDSGAFESGLRVKELHEGFGFLGENAIKSIRIQFLVRDEATGNPLSSMEVMNGFAPSYQDFRNLTAAQSFGGIVLSEPADEDRLIELLLSEAFLGTDATRLLEDSEFSETLEDLFGGL